MSASAQRAMAMRRRRNSEPETESQDGPPYGVAVWRRGEYIAIESEHDEYHEAERRAAYLHDAVNEGRFRPSVYFQPQDIERLELDVGFLERTDAYVDA